MMMRQSQHIQPVSLAILVQMEICKLNSIAMQSECKWQQQPQHQLENSIAIPTAHNANIHFAVLSRSTLAVFNWIFAYLPYCVYWPIANWPRTEWGGGVGGSIRLVKCGNTVFAWTWCVFWQKSSLNKCISSG